MIAQQYRTLMAALAMAAVATAGCASPGAGISTADQSGGGRSVTASGPGGTAGSTQYLEQSPYPVGRTAVPDVLVGTWDGDRADISISPDGGFRYSYPTGLVIDGTVAAIDNSTLTVFLSGQQYTMAWSVEQIDAGYGYRFLNLALDGVSYVREV